MNVYSFSIVIFFLNPGTSQLLKNILTRKCVVVFIGLRARGRLTEFRFGMAWVLFNTIYCAQASLMLKENNMRDRSKRSNNWFMWIEVCCVTCWKVHLLFISLRSAYEITVHAVCYKTAKKTNNANMYKHIKKQLFSHENLYRKYIQCSSMFHAWQNCLISISNFSYTKGL